MFAAIVLMTATFMSSPGVEVQADRTFTFQDKVYSRGSLIRETRFDFKNGKDLQDRKETNIKTVPISDTGGRPIILQVSGTGKMTDGSVFDCHYIGDSAQSAGEFLSFKIDGVSTFAPTGHQIIDLNPRVFNTSHTYSSFLWMKPDHILKIEQKLDAYVVDYTTYVSHWIDSGSFTIGIYEAVSGEKLTVDFVDGRAFNDPTQNVSVGPSDGFPIQSPSPSQLQAFATSPVLVEKAAADGTTLLLIRTKLTGAGTVTFQLDGDGALFPLAGNPYAYREAKNLESPVIPVSLLSGIENYAFALYRVPASIENLRTKPISIRAEYEPSGAGNQSLNGFGGLALVRPPVVLVHGTYDTPRECWQLRDADDGPNTMFERLTAAGYRVFCVDWEATNGRTDPSDFNTNRMTVFQNKDGIQAALTALRDERTAVTQVDVVAHSQGGVISRVFARGRPLDEKMEPTDPHFNNPQECRNTKNCWYHAKRNFGRGDIRRFVTISTTHFGSEIPRIFSGIAKLRDKSPSDGATRIFFNAFEGAVQEWMTGVRTGGFRDQTPGSKAQQNIGPTPVKSHAIAAVCNDEVMETGKAGFYAGRMKTLWKAIPRYALEGVFEELNQPQAGIELHQAALNYDKLGFTDEKAIPFRDLLRHFRRVAFRGEENDCVVALSSSLGGLTAKHTTKIDGVLHSWAPRNADVQDRVITLLEGPEGAFSAVGFPDTDVEVDFSRPTLLPIEGPVTPANPANEGNKRRVSAETQKALESAQALIGQGKLAEAEFIISQACDANPKDPYLWSAKSSLLLSLRRVDGAIYASTQAVSLEPGNPDFHGGLGMAYLAAYDFAKAVTAYQETVRLAPANGFYHGALSASLIGAQKYTEAEKSAKEAVRLEPKFALHQLYMGDALAFQNRWVEALPFYTECVKLDPNQPGGHAGLGGVAMVQNRFADAEVSYRKAISLTPYVGIHHANLAGVLLRQGKKTEALAAAQEAKRLGQMQHWVYVELGIGLTTLLPRPCAVVLSY